MNDHPQTKAVRVQSSAIVLAAIITTCGAVTSALIQTSFPGKPSSPTVAAAQSSLPTKTPAYIAEAMDVPQELALAISQPAPPRPQTFATPAATVSFHAPVADSKPTAATDNNSQAWNVEKPELSPAQSAARPLVSPWYYLQQPARTEARGDAAKTAKKGFDWSTIPRWLQLHN